MDAHFNLGEVATAELPSYSVETNSFPKSDLLKTSLVTWQVIRQSFIGCQFAFSGFAIGFDLFWILGARVGDGWLPRAFHGGAHVRGLWSTGGTATHLFSWHGRLETHLPACLQPAYHCVEPTRQTLSHTMSRHTLQHSLIVANNTILSPWQPAP